MIDEAHHANSKSYTETLEKLCADARYVGVTATPFRTDGAGLSHAGFDTLVTGPSVAQLIEDGFLVKPEYLVEHLIDTASVRVKGADYGIGHLSERVRAATDAIVQTYIQHAQILSGLEWINVGASKPDGGHVLISPHLATALQRQTHVSQVEWNASGIQNLRNNTFIKAGGFYFKPAETESGGEMKVRNTIFFAVDVAHSKELCAALVKAGIKAQHIDANTPINERDDMMSQFRAGTLQAPTNCTIATEGMSLRMCACVHVCVYVCVCACMYHILTQQSI